MERTLFFQKENNNRWYVVLPEWTGDKEELEMVCGADTMLDIVAQGEYETSLYITDQIFDTYSFKLTFIRPESGGAWYELNHNFYNFEVWLCHVTKFVFNDKLPDIIYCK